jgi:hypothetical protein
MLKSIPGALALGLALTACGGSTYSATPVTPLAPAVTHLYVGDDQTPGFMRVYELPLTAASTPVASIPMSSPINIGSNASNVAVTTLSGSVNIFTQPLTSASLPIATFNSTGSGIPFFTASGSLIQAGGTKVNVYTPPFSNSSVPSSTIAVPGTAAQNLAIDPAGNIYVGSDANTIGAIVGGVLTTIVTAPAGTQFRGMAATATQLFVVEFGGGSQGIDVFSLPLTAASTPVATIDNGQRGGEAAAVDANGNLYVGNLGDRTVEVFSPPFTNSSVPVLTLNTNAEIFGISIGP